MPTKHRDPPIATPEEHLDLGGTLRAIVDSCPVGRLLFHVTDDDGFKTVTIDSIIDGQLRSVTKATFLGALQELAGTSPTKKCPKCGQTKAIEFFALNRSSQSGRAQRCRICEAKRMREFTAKQRAAKTKPNKPRRNLYGIAKQKTK